MTNLKRDNHFVPECYQKGFTDSSGRVWVKFSDKSEAEHRQPRSVGKRRSLYIRNQNGVENDTIEDFFGKAVETPFAALSRRINEEREKFSTIRHEEQTALCRFVASQTMRTIGHKQAIEEQAGNVVETNLFLDVMLRKIWVLLDSWIKNLPDLEFYTSLPHVGDRFITGDSPVVVIQVNNNPLWVPTDVPRSTIANLTDILQHPNHRFLIPLTPYVCVAINPKGDGTSHLPPQAVDPQFVRFMNELVAGQSKIFVLARDKESLP